MPKFFVSPNDVQENFLVLTGENAAHAKVLRLQCGETVTVCDGVGQDLTCVVSDVSPGQISLVVQSREASRAEPPVACSVYMAYAKADKLEHVIQKATELGATEIVALSCRAGACRARMRNRWPKNWNGGRRSRLLRRSSPAEGRIPSVLTVNSYREAVERAARSELPLFPYENERTVSLRAAIGPAQFRTAAIMTGPEGGFSEDEVQLAEEAGMKICSLGPRICGARRRRSAALSAVLYAAGALE